MVQVGVVAYIKCGVYDNVQIQEKYFWLIASSFHLQFCSFLPFLFGLMFLLVTI